MGFHRLELPEEVDCDVCDGTRGKARYAYITLKSLQRGEIVQLVCEKCYQDAMGFV
jgi:hypothetical protein